MVWVIEGNIKGSDKDEEGYPSISSHYLRPSRAYKLGRLSYSSTDSNGKTLKSKPHLLDFQLKTNAVPKDGAWTITTGDWTEANATDSPNSATNLDPYSLTITATKALARRKVGQDDSQKEELDANIPHELRDGDVVRFLKEGQFSVRWVPMILCIPLASVSQKELYLRQAVQLGSLHSISSQKNSLTDVPQIGIKLAYRKFLSHHTHLLTKTLKANYNLFYASMLLRPICSPDYLSQLSIYVALPVRPANFPQIPENGVIDAKLEKTILELDPSVNPGFDVKRYWQHSVLENDWKKLPRTDSEGMTPASDSARPELDIEKWKPDERRKTLFKGILVVSFRKDSVEEHIIQLGGGYIYSCDLLQPEVQTWTLTAALEEFKSDNNVPDNIRIIIFPPNLEGDEGKLKQPLRAFADAIGVGSYTDDEAFLRAIAEVNPNVLDSGMSVEETQEASSALPFISSLLLPPSPDSPQSEPQDQLLVPPTAVQPTSSAPQAPASSFREIPGTHPEEGRVPARNRALRNSVQGGAEAGPSGEGQKSLPLPAAAEEEVVGPVRKLTRRIRSTKPAASASVDPFAFSSAADSRQPHTQVDAPELRAESTQATEVDDDISFIAPVRKLKRRGGPSQSEGSSSIFDIPSSYNTESPAKKSRTSTIAEEEEDSPASTLASNKGGATQLSAVDEELESTPVAGSSTSNPRKRGASEAVGSGDEDASRATALPARKTRRSTSEAPEEPVVVPARGKKVAPTPVKGKKGATTKKGAKDKDKDKPVEDEGLLRMKTVKRKGAEIDQGFNDDFNALKIVKPTLQPMKTQKGRRLAWNENDADEDLDRLIREDQEREENGDEWDGEGEGAGRGMFMVELVSMVRKNRPPPKEADPEGKFAGRPNFKKFRSKNSNAPKVDRPPRAKIEFTLAEPDDFGLAYTEKPKRGTALQHAANDDDGEDDDDDDDFGTTQLKLSFGKAKGKASAKAPAKAPAKAAPKGKSKATTAIVISDSDDSDAADNKPDAMDVDSDSDTSHTQTSQKSKASSSKKAPAASSSKAKAPAPAKKAPARAKKSVAPTMFVDDNDSDGSDGGLTFKGFGTKRKR